jgi:hypothetical protein
LQIRNTVALPVITPTSGTYLGQVSIKITCETPDVILLVTTDGTQPTSEADVWKSGKAVEWTDTGITRITTMGTKTGMQPSATVVAVFEVESDGTVQFVFGIVVSVIMSIAIASAAVYSHKVHNLVSAMESTLGQTQQGRCQCKSVLFENAISHKCEQALLLVGVPLACTHSHCPFYVVSSSSR